jgi:hypothetical protein
MKIALYLLISIAVRPVFADVDFNPAQQILMQGQSCEELATHAQSILEWNELITKKSNPLPECFCSSKSCQMDVAPISPYFVKELTNYTSGFGAESAYAGPNCFNAALVSSGALPHITFTHPLEIRAILASSMCTERSISEPLVPGDILLVRNQSDPHFEVHAGVSIGTQVN